MSNQIAVDHFLNQVEVNHGPQALLARYFLAAANGVAASRSEDWAIGA